MRNIDLHCHSSVSDGMLTPTLVAARAKANGVDVWALTDHDELAGIPQARHAAKEFGLGYVPGVEISVTWCGTTLHIVGLQIDERNRALVKGLEKTRSGRENRAREIGKELGKVGIQNAYKAALKYAGNPDLISRTHFARHLVESGVCKDVGEVFRNYLTEGKPGYVPHRWASLEETVQWIRGAGGVAVIAHPGRYDLTDLQFDVLFSQFKEMGGKGIEVVTGSHTPDQYKEYAKVAQRYGFLASRGSDFHAPGESRADLGTLPPLPDSLTPVWHDWF